ncbi:amino acid ABC transporter ATP-binding protein [Mycolicibacterium sp. YH-1]|uniref:amino acid ABC transporter ATP-binding protein n=1 Tax=Mycolicibacterium sp. YH-1 TaxID=2908837 RepID=UPI001F4BF97B|nr:amino acid ABC transporter ATP-binding protein [Mycolicibacterium sp. YH-1]UNB51628.1 amino acid ABC transporter ATP-binding protein [Mycolicibacterium sp. YH-1]
MTNIEQKAVNPLAVHISDLSVAYGSNTVLNGIDLDVAKGQVLCLIGRSGCGKSTLLRTMNGLAKANSGSIDILGRRMDKDTNFDDLRTSVGMVFQSYNLFPHMRVIDNVAVGPRKVLKRSKQEARDIARKQLEHVGLAEKADHWPSQLSGGQQQRVAIARSLAMNPQLLLLDEVTAALDPETVGSVLAVIRGLAKDGMTMVLVTHEMSFAYEVSDLVAYLEGGKVIEIGSAKELLTQPNDDRTRKFLTRTLPAAAIPPLEVPK